MYFLRAVSVIFCLFSLQAFAGDVDIVGKISVPLKPVPIRHTLAPNNHVLANKQVTLMKVQLSDAAKTKLTERITTPVQHAEHQTAEHLTVSPAYTQLGMAGVPVLDQGVHGSCVVFAVTAALDAAIHRHDYISQLCLLQLGQQLQHYSYTPSGWQGSWGRAVFNQIETFGVVNKIQQHVHGCGGITEYPTHDNAPEEGMSPTDYHALSEPLFGLVTSTSILEPQQIIFDRLNMVEILDNVKSSLQRGDRLTFATLLLNIDKGVAGATGQHHVANDTWILLPNSLDDLERQESFGAHELIITGYDDHAKAIDTDGREHVGLLTLRNSWGNKAGDQGTFYMSYDYFKALAFEIQRIRGPHIT